MPFYLGSTDDTHAGDFYFEVGRSNFFSKRSIKNLPLKRTKSVTKLERSKRGGGNSGGLLSSNHSIQSTHLLNQHTSNNTTQCSSAQGSGSGVHHPGLQVQRGHQPPPAHHLSSTTLGETAALGSLSRLRSSQSHESLLSTHNQQMMNTLDLAAGEAVINPLHESILGQKYCFQISSPAGARYFSCRSSEERDKWVESLRRAVNPHADHKCRVHNSFRVVLVEAKGVAPKKKYFCELLLDDVLYARTSVKAKHELCFWGEQFEFRALPAVHVVTVALYREEEKRRKKDKQTLVGRVNIPVSTVTSRALVEKWYSVDVDGTASKTPSKGSVTSSKDAASLRIKCAFQTVHVLPLGMYEEFHQFLLSSYASVCGLLEPAVSVATKADVATTLVHLSQHSRAAATLIADIVVAEVDKNDNAHLIFRGNSVATKAMEAFMKLVGARYLHEALEPAIAEVLQGDQDCEVDPKKVANESVIPRNQQNLISIVQMTWNHILRSNSAFPPELRQCFVLFRERLQSMAKECLSDKLISASIFLRFLCPAILNPSLFQITQELPNEKATRNLTLVAKTLQTLANFTKFQGKEHFMEFMNDFIEAEQDEMRSFLKRISTRSTVDERAMEFSGDIDLGIQLSVLHCLLSECLPNMKPVTTEEQQKKENLQRIINDLTAAKSHANIDLVQSLVSQNITSITTTTTSTMIQHQLIEDTRQRFQPLTQNIFVFNDPTSPSMTENYSDIHHKNNAYNYHKDGGGNNGHQQPVNGYTGHQNVVLGPLSHPIEQPSTPRSSTLPRNTYLMGSGRKPPAMDLNTADDYVHFSALGSDNDQADVKSHDPIVHSFSQNHIPSESPQHHGSSTPLHNQNHHRHFHNHMAYYNNARQIYNTNGGQGSPQHINQNGLSNHNVAANGHHTNGHMNVDDSLNSSHEYDQNSSGDAETNMKGSQTSISQLSNIASSGYQSFAYSQSSSPVDPVITHNDVTNNNNNVSNHHQKVLSANNNNNNNNSQVTNGISVAQMPYISHVMQPPPQVAALAFNNPMYHLSTNTNGSPRSASKMLAPHPMQQQQHHHNHLPQYVQSSRQYPLSHSQSAHTASYTARDTTHQNHNNPIQNCTSSLSSAQSVEDLACVRVTLSGSEDTASVVSTTSTPPMHSSSSVETPRLNSYHNGKIHINPHHNQHQTNNSFKSSAPRTNPRCLPPPVWQQQQQHHSSITNIPNTISNIKTQHHHSTSDLLASCPHQRRPSHKTPRRQSAEFTPSRQRLLIMNNYDSTSDDTSSDERQAGHGLYVRQRHHNASNNISNTSNNASNIVQNRISNNRISDTKSLEEYENEIQTLKRMLDNLQLELKEKHHIEPTPSASNTSTANSSDTSINTPPSPAPKSPMTNSNISKVSNTPSYHNQKEKCQETSAVAAQPPRTVPFPPASLSVSVVSKPAAAATAPSVRGEVVAAPSSLSSELNQDGSSQVQNQQLQELLRKLLSVQVEKDAVIEAQKQHITSLDDTTARLMQAYHHLTKHINVMDLERVDPETSASIAAVSAAVTASLDIPTPTDYCADSSAAADYRSSPC